MSRETDERQPAAANQADLCGGGLMRWDCFRKFGACEMCVYAREGLVESLGGDYEESWRIFRT